MKFVADSMLGKLAKWLRVLGYDTHYQSHYEGGEIDRRAAEGRVLLTRHRETAERVAGAIFLHGDRIGEQMGELKGKMLLNPDPTTWFSRCLICNVVLEQARSEEARENVPEYIFHQSLSAIRTCPVCGRYYWPGSHRTRMFCQLDQWGFSIETAGEVP